MNKTSKTIWLVGGGTGGHISPAISIYESLNSQGHQPVLFTLERNKDYPPIQNMDTKNKKVVYYRSSPIPKSIKSLVLFIRDLKFSLRLLNNERRHIAPDAVLAFGGYPVFPALFWAWLHKVPFYLHEQNVRHGVITRLFSFGAKKIFLSFAQKSYTAKETLTGNPLRKIFLTYKPATKKRSKKNTARKILMLGGSQGASDINRLYLEMIQSDFFKNDIITISTGKNDYEKTLKMSQKPTKKQAKTTNRSQDQILAFIEDVPGAMMESDVIISRSGSGMIFEILWSGKPACFIPFPYAASDHQKYNSLAISKQGLYETIDIRPFDPAAAMKLFAEFISTLAEKTSGQNKTTSPKTDAPENPLMPPLNAHERITELVLQDLE